MSFVISAKFELCVATILQELSRWLDPNYAHPAPTLMAFQWVTSPACLFFGPRVTVFGNVAQRLKRMR